MSELSYVIKSEEFNSFYRLIELVHGHISIVRMFCREYEDMENFYKIIPILDNAVKKSGLLYAEFTNLKYDKIEKKT